MLVRQLSSINRKRSNSGSTPNDGAVSVGDDEGAPDTALATPRDGRCLKLLRALSCGFPVLHPDGRFRSFWNTIMAILICFCGVAIPLDIAFETDMIRSMCPIDGQLYPFCPKWQVWKWVNYVVDFCFMCDIIINCRTGYLKEGYFVDEDLKALNRYLRGWFIPDFIGTFPINWVIEITSANCTSTDCSIARSNRFLRMLRLVKLTKLTRMLKLSQYLEYVEMVVKFNPAFLRVFRLCLWMMISCHWFACIWWLVADFEMVESTDPNDPTGTLIYPEGSHCPHCDNSTEWDAGENQWVPPIWLKNSPDLDVKYWYAFYWGAGIAFAMTPFDIMPVTTPEAVVTTILMCIGLLLNAFVISSFTSAFAAMDSKHALAGKQLDLIRAYLMLKAVPGDLRSRILDYFQYIYTSSQSMDHLGQLQQMPPNLSTQLALSVNAKLIARCAFFNEINDTALVSIVNALEPLVFVPGQALCIEGQMLTAIYFINRGKVHVLRKMGADDEELISVLGDGSNGSNNLGLDEYLGKVWLSGPRAASPPLDGHHHTQRGDREASEDDGQPAAPIMGERRVRHSARALTYCDVMQLSPLDLSAALEHDTAEKERKLKAEKKIERQNTAGSRLRKKMKVASLLCRGLGKGGSSPSPPTLDAESRLSHSGSSTDNNTPGDRLRSVFAGNRLRGLTTSRRNSNDDPDGGYGDSNGGGKGPSPLSGGGNGTANGAAGWGAVMRHVDSTRRHCRFADTADQGDVRSESKRVIEKQEDEEAVRRSLPPAPAPAPAPALTPTSTTCALEGSSSTATDEGELEVPTVTVDLSARMVAAPAVTVAARSHVPATAAERVAVMAEVELMETDEAPAADAPTSQASASDDATAEVLAAAISRRGARRGADTRGMRRMNSDARKIVREHPGLTPEQNADLKATENRLRQDLSSSTYAAPDDDDVEYDEQESQLAI